MVAKSKINAQVQLIEAREWEANGKKGMSYTMHLAVLGGMVAAGMTKEQFGNHNGIKPGTNVKAEIGWDPAKAYQCFRALLVGLETVA